MTGRPSGLDCGGRSPRRIKPATVMIDPAAQSRTSPSRRTAKRVALVLSVYVFLVAMSALYWFPPIPRSTIGWLTFLLLAPPLYLVGEWIGDRVTRPWWESSLLGKAIKTVLFVLVALGLITVGALLRGL